MTIRFGKFNVLLSVLFFAVSASALKGGDALAQAPYSAEAEQLDFAHGLLERGLYEMAVSEYDKFITQHPKAARLEEAYFGIAESYFQAEEHEKALNAFEKFKEAYPKSEKFLSALLRAGQIFLKTNRFDEALKEFSAANPDGLTGQLQQNFYYYMAKAYRFKRDVATAKKYYEKSAQAKDAALYSAFAYSDLAEMALEAKDFVAAAGYYKQASNLAQNRDDEALFVYREGEASFFAGQFADAAQIFKSVVKVYADLAIARDALANTILAYYNLGEYRDALNFFKENESLAKDEPAFIDVFYAYALSLIELDRFKEARAGLDRIMAIDGLEENQKNKAALKKAEIFIKEKKFKEGLELLAGQNAQGPDADQVLFLTGKANAGMGNFDKAFEMFKQVKTSFPTSEYTTPALWGMAQAEYELNKPEEARKYYWEYFISENNADLRSEALYNVILLDDQSGKLAQAIESAEKYLTLFPEGKYSEKAVALLGEFYVRAQNYDKAVTLLSQYLKNTKIVESADTLLFLLGYNYQMSSQWQEALEAYAKVTPRDAGGKYYASALSNTAQIYLTQEKPAEAAVAFERIMTEVGAKAVSLKTYLWLCGRYLEEKKLDGLLGLIENIKAAYPAREDEAVLYYAGEAWREKDDCKKADELYVSAIAGKFKNVYTGASHIGRGLCFTQKGEFDKAINEFAKTLEENAEDNTLTMRARFETARALESQKKPDEALRFYLLVAALYDDNTYTPQALLQAGSLLEQQLKKEEALKTYKEILQRYPDSEVLERALARIKALSEN